MKEVIDYLIIGASNGCVYSLIAIGFILIFKCSKVFNFAQSEITILGAYLFYGATVQLKLPFIFGILMTLGIAVILSLTIERALLRPLIGQPIVSVIILTLALAGFMRGGMILIWGAEWLTLPSLFPKGGVHIGKIAILSYTNIFFIIVPLVFILLLGIYYRYSWGGLAMRVTADDTVVARLLGVKVTRVLAMSWIIASVVGAVGGILLTSVTGVHYLAVEIGFKSMAVAMVGGLESLAGVILMGPFLGIVETLLAGYLDPLVGGGLSEVAAFFVLLVVLVFRPHGIFGWRTIERV
jgi:branched-chain amino acid transport system permease protein